MTLHRKFAAMLLQDALHRGEIHTSVADVAQSTCIDALAIAWYTWHYYGLVAA